MNWNTKYRLFRNKGGHVFLWKYLNWKKIECLSRAQVKNTSTLQFIYKYTCIMSDK